MKSKLLLVLAASFLLVGCNQNNEVSSKEGSEEISSETSKQSSETISESEEITSSEDSTSEESSSSSESQQGGTEHKFTAQFYNVNDGTVTTGDSNGNSFTSIVQTYFLDGDNQLLKTASSTGFAQLNYVGNKGDEGRFSTMILGSKSNVGNLTLDFNYKVTKVKVEAQGYCKYIPYNQTWSVDEGCGLFVNGTSNYLDLPTTSEGGEKYTAEYSFSGGVDKLVFDANEGARAFLHSLEITYLA